MCFDIIPRRELSEYSLTLEVLLQLEVWCSMVREIFQISFSNSRGIIKDAVSWDRFNS